MLILLMHTQQNPTEDDGCTQCHHDQQGSQDLSFFVGERNPDDLPVT